MTYGMADEQQMDVRAELMGTLRIGTGIGAPPPHLTWQVADTLTSGSHPHSNMLRRRREDDTNIVAATLTKNYGKQPDNSDTNGGPPNLIYRPQDVRRLTPHECERLQGFPDGWTAVDGDATPDSRRYAAMGDAVTTNVAEWIGHRLARYGEQTQPSHLRGNPS